MTNKNNHDRYKLLNTSKRTAQVSDEDYLRVMKALDEELAERLDSDSIINEYVPANEIEELSSQEKEEITSYLKGKKFIGNSLREFEECERSKGNIISKEGLAFLRFRMSMAAQLKGHVNDD
jgi:hypothetical protein